MRFSTLYDGLLACLQSLWNSSSVPAHLHDDHPPRRHIRVFSWKLMSFVLATFSAILVATNFDGYYDLDLDLSWAHVGRSLRHQLRLVNDVFEMVLPNEPLSIFGSRYDSFDLASGAQFFNEQTMHLTNAWALIEGLGVPAGTIFDPYRK